MCDTKLAGEAGNGAMVPLPLLSDRYQEVCSLLCYSSLLNPLSKQCGLPQIIQTQKRNTG